jgi:hypothetical protein
MMYRGSGTMNFGPFKFATGSSLATFVSYVCLISTVPIAMNQFAVDKAGLTMTLLSPLSDRDLLAGKAVGNALIAAGPILVCLGVVLLAFPIGSPWPWITLVASLCAVYLIVAPIAAICSAMFPRQVDMNSIGRGSNAHAAAGLVGMLAFLGAAVPPVLLSLLATQVLGRPVLAPLLVIGWCAVAYIIHRMLSTTARRILRSRRENLALLA